MPPKMRVFDAQSNVCSCEPVGVEIDEDPQFTPMHDFVLIRPIPKGQTEGGLALPETADTGPGMGKVLKVGPGRVTEEGALVAPCVKPGDVVYMHFAYAPAVEMTLGGKKYAITRSRDIIGLAS